MLACSLERCRPSPHRPPRLSIVSPLCPLWLSADVAFDAFFQKFDPAIQQVCYACMLHGRLLAARGDAHPPAARAPLPRLTCASMPLTPGGSQALLASPQALRALGVYHVLPQAVRWGFAAFNRSSGQAPLAGCSSAVPARLLLPSSSTLSHRTPQMTGGQKLQTLARDAQVSRGAATRTAATAGACRVPSALTGAHLVSPPHTQQGQPLSLTVRHSGGGVSFEGVGSTARLIIPDVPVCEVSRASRRGAGQRATAGLHGLARGSTCAHGCCFPPPLVALRCCRE